MVVDSDTVGPAALRPTRRIDVRVRWMRSVLVPPDVSGQDAYSVMRGRSFMLAPTGGTVKRRALVLLLLLLFPAQMSAASYQVRPGDTLSVIASRYHTTVYELAQLNHLLNVNLIRVGSVLRVPGSAAPAALSYHVRWGDTLTGLSQRFGLSIAAIRAMNPTLGRYLLAGSWLRLSGSGSGTAQSAVGNGWRYVVKPGDALISIAAQFGVSAAAIAAANTIADPNHIVIGSVLVVPPSQVASAAPYDSGQTQAAIADWARTYGIDPALALAVAWQESGFNQNLVSATGAIGVMQVEPYTGARIDALLGRSLDLTSIDSNIQAGVFWLAHLLAYYGGNERLAVAAYYQGSRSINRIGLYADTVQYVDDVMALQVRFGG